MIVRQSLLITFLFLYTHSELAHIFVANSEVALGSILELRISTVLAARITIPVELVLGIAGGEQAGVGTAEIIVVLVSRC